MIPDAKEIERLEKKAAKWERHDARQAQHQEFVDEHDLACFKCQSRLVEWAGTGTNEWGRPWAICSMCVRKKRAA